MRSPFHGNSLDRPYDFLVEVDGVDRKEWSALLRQFDDAHIAQTWDFAKSICPGQQVSRLVLRSGNKAVALAQVRIAAVPLLSRGLAHVAFGPVWRKRGSPPDPHVFEAVVAALREEYTVRRKLLLRLSPYILDNGSDGPISTLMRLGFERAREPHPSRTIIVDISRPLPELRKALEKEWRRCLTRAEQNHMEIRQGISPELYGEFLPIYREMVERKGLEPDADPDRWAILQTVLPEMDKPNIFLVYHEGKAVSGLIVSCLGDTGYPILAAATGPALKHHASYLMHWQAISWLKEKGCRRYDLVGIDPEKNPGTYHFKKGFRGEEVSGIGAFEVCISTLSAALVRFSEPIRNTTLRWARTCKNRRVKPVTSKGESG